jgi:linoleate 10R-lipoxygenase
LAKILHEATETVACAYGARGIPAVTRVVEIMGIEQARGWGVCMMDEFREFVGLKKYGSFKEWNRTGDIAVSFLLI